MDTLSIGKHNPRLAEIGKALHYGTLTGDGLLAIEGLKLVGEALKSGLDVVSIFVRCDLDSEVFPAGIPVFSLDPPAFRKIQATESSQGVVALVRVPSFALEDLIAAPPAPQAPIVILDGLQDPGNVGTILRIAESFAAAGCVALAGTASIHNSKVVRASAGSVFRLPVVRVPSLAETATALQAAGIALVATSPHAVETITEWDWRTPTAIVIGNEGSGLSPENAQRCDKVLRIPHQANVESLNSAIATAVILYEAFKQRGLH